MNKFLYSSLTLTSVCFLFVACGENNNETASLTTPVKTAEEIKTEISTQEVVTAQAEPIVVQHAASEDVTQVLDVVTTEVPIVETLVEPDVETVVETQVMDETLAKQISAGDDLYHQMCAHCHGANMKSIGASAFDLREFPLDEKTRFFESVLNGKGSMPAWAGKIEEAEIEDLFTYVTHSK